jgi:hypothetical protein
VLSARPIANAATRQHGHQYPDLAQHAHAIKAAGTRVISDVIEIGRHLTEAKKLCGHGEWLPWLEREFGWTDQTARNFMRVFDLSNSKRVLDLDLPLSSLYLLAAPSTPDEAKTEIIERAEKGEELHHTDVKEIIEQHAELDEHEEAGEVTEPLVDHHHRRKDGRIDHKLEQFERTIHSLRNFGDPLARDRIDYIKFPPNLTPKMVSDARKKIKEGIAGAKEAIAGLRKLDARLAAYASSIKAVS